MCNNFIECQNATDEAFCAGGGVANTVLLSVSGGFVLIYIILKIIWYIYAKTNENQVEVSIDLKQNSGKYFDLIKNPEDEETIENTNNYLLRTLYFSKEKQRVKIFKRFFKAIAKMKNFDEAQIFSYFHKNINPMLVKNIMNAQYPGIKSKAVASFEGLLKKEYCTNFTDQMREKHDLNYFCTSIKSIIKMLLKYVDIFKDVAFAFHLLVSVGGVKTLFDFPNNFTTVLIAFFFASIVFPLFLATLELAVEDPGMIFLQSGKPVTGCKRIFYQIGNFLLSPILPILLINNCEIHKEMMKTAAKTGHETKNRLMNYHKSHHVKATFVKTEIGLEVFYLILVQIILLLMSRTTTATTGGLETMFDTDTVILGIDINPLTLLGISTILSLKSCIFSRLHTMKSEKIFFPSVSQMVVIVWSIFAVLRRILIMTAFFIPSFGFFSLLNHWKFEQIPFQSRLDYAIDFGIKESDKIELRGLNQTIYWKELDRWDYTIADNPTPPDYCIYTGASLKIYFCLYFVLMAVHFVVIYIAKNLTARSFKGVKNIVVKFIHVVENQNFSYPFLDWDIDEEGKSEKEDFEKQHR